MIQNLYLAFALAQIRQFETVERSWVCRDAIRGTPIVQDMKTLNRKEDKNVNKSWAS